ncbi:MAG: hypothetical protein ACU826_10740, partial [Gammaproteobacteria bacterium]
MATALFLATFVFVAYVLYSSVFGGEKSATKSSAPAAKPKASEKPKPAAKAKAVEKVKVAEAPKAEPAKKAAATTGSITLKNPATGETASVPTNYRFAKRWIKEAMVSEGLLDKIYKNNELEGAV